MDCYPGRGVGRFNPPMSTRLRSYGNFQIVAGDFDDTFLINTHWDGSVSLYVIEESGDLSFINEFESLKHVIKVYPGFNIIDPNNANERYLPPLVSSDFKKR